MNTLADILLIALAIVVGYRYGKRQSANAAKARGWMDGFETGANAMAVAIADEQRMQAAPESIVISAAHRDAQVRNARKGMQ